MPTLQELMGQEIYDLLYVHHDRNGQLIGDVEDALNCDDDGIPQDRIPKLEALLMPITDAPSSLVPLEAARVLAEWGSDKAIDYMEYCIDRRIDRLGNLNPHRLHGYDTTYERMIDLFFGYHARYADRGYAISKTYNEVLGERARQRIFSPLVKIIELSKECVVDMGFLIRTIKDYRWKEYLPVLKDCYLELIMRPESDRSRQWNLPLLEKLLREWEPGFVREV